MILPKNGIKIIKILQKHGIGKIIIKMIDRVKKYYDLTKEWN